LECSGRLVDPEDRGHDLVMERRHHDLDTVVHDDLQPAERVLLGRQDARGPALRRLGEVIDEPVNAGGRESAGSARDELPPRQAHVRTAEARS
jgi:hypothetical protein